MTATMLAAMAWRMSTPRAVSIGMIRTPPPSPMRAPSTPATTAPRRMAISKPGVRCMPGAYPIRVTRCLDI